MAGAWRVTSAVLREAEEDMHGVYDGRQIAAVTPACGDRWTSLVAVVTPRADAAWNGTALQLRVTPPGSQFGARVWVGNASIVQIS